MIGIDLGHDPYVPGDPIPGSASPYCCADCGRSMRTREYGFACEQCGTAKASEVTVDYRVWAAQVGEVVALNIHTAEVEAIVYAARAAASYALDWLGRESERSAA